MTLLRTSPSAPALLALLAISSIAPLAFAQATPASTPTPAPASTPAASSPTKSDAPAKPTTSPTSATRTGDDIVAEFEGMKAPAYDGKKAADDASYRDAFAKQRTEYLAKRADLVAELLKVQPDHAKAAKFVGSRWGMMAQTGKAEEVLSEIKPFMDRKDALGVEASYYFALATGEATSYDKVKTLAAIDAFAARASSSDERAAGLLSSLGEELSDVADKKAVYSRLSKEYPNARAAKSAAGKMKQLEAVGKPFDFKFTDAIGGKEVSRESLKGKIVVVDFWATWCGPCVAEMPKMKELYAKLKTQGVEFIGISLDQPEDKGGLTKLKDFVAKNEIGWPQYYQGNFWQSEFSSSWGINSIPAVFVVDHEGNLANTNARGKIDTIVAELLTKRDGQKK